MNILVESKKPNLNDMLLSYSVLPLLKQKYPFANITFGTNTFYSTFFRRADIIDNVIMQS